MAKLWPGHDSGTHKHTHRFWNTQTHTPTGKTLYALPPFYGGGIKNNPLMVKLVADVDNCHRTDLTAQHLLFGRDILHLNRNHHYILIFDK